MAEFLPGIHPVGFSVIGGKDERYPWPETVRCLLSGKRDPIN